MNKKKECGYCIPVIAEIKKLFPFLPEDIIQKIRKVCPSCRELQDQAEIENISKEIKAYFDKQNIPDQTCAVCGKTGKMALSACCNKPMCVEAPKRSKRYRNKSCYEGHARYTLCASHHTEGHSGDWKNCRKCIESCEAEMYNWYGTNEYNFDKLPKLLEYEPAICKHCGKVISLVNDGYSGFKGDYTCWDCLLKEDSLDDLCKKDKKKEKTKPKRR